MFRFRLNAGTYVNEQGDGKRYKKGDVFLSPFRLDQMFARLNKFTLVNEPSPAAVAPSEKTPAPRLAKPLPAVEEEDEDEFEEQDVPEDDEEEDEVDKPVVGKRGKRGRR